MWIRGAVTPFSRFMLPTRLATRRSERITLAVKNCLARLVLPARMTNPRLQILPAALAPRFNRADPITNGNLEIRSLYPYSFLNPSSLSSLIKIATVINKCDADRSGFVTPS